MLATIFKENIEGASIMKKKKKSKKNAHSAGFEIET
jgi:hypothetical protein